MELNTVKEVFKSLLPGSPISTIEQIDIGLINQTFFVESQNEKFIVQAINEKVFKNYKKGLENILLVKKWLLESNFKYEFPTPIGNQYYDIKNNIWRIYPYVDKTLVFDKINNTKQAYQAAKCLGAFYKCLNNKQATKLHVIIPDFHNGAKRLKQLEESLLNAPIQRLKLAEQLITIITKQKKTIEKFDKLISFLPKRVVHHDTKISNFLFDRDTNNVKAIIDLDTIMPGCVLSDIGEMIRTYCNSEGEESKEISKVIADKSIIEQIINGFLSEAEIEKEEKKHLKFSGKAITLIQSIRFLTDYLSGDNYYHTNYEDHNLIRAKNQFKLFVSF